MGSGSSDAGTSHYEVEDLVYCGLDHGLNTAEEDEEAILYTLTIRSGDLPLPDVEDLEAVRFCEAKQDRPCNLQCPKGRAEGGEPRGDGDDHHMAEEVAPTGLGGGNRAADVGPFPEAVEEMNVSEDRGLLHMVVPAFFAPLPTNLLAGLPPHGAPLAEVQRLQQNFDKMTELLTRLLGNVQKMITRLDKVECKVQGSLPHVGKNKDDIKALGARVRELELFNDTLPQFVHAHFNLSITEFEQYLMWHWSQPTMVPQPKMTPPLSTPSLTRTSYSSSAPSVPQPGPSGEQPCAQVPPVSARIASAPARCVAQSIVCPFHALQGPLG